MPDDKKTRTASDIGEGKLKKCSTCGELKPIEAFKDPKLKSGIGRKCLACKEEKIDDLETLPWEDWPVRGPEPFVETDHFWKYWGWYFGILFFAVLWVFGVLLYDKDLFIGWWGLPALGLCVLMFYGHYLGALRRDPAEFGKPGYDAAGRPLAHSKPGDLFPLDGPSEKITHTEYAWRNTRYSVGLIIWCWGIGAFFYFTD